ncbi:putative pectate lyase C [Escovopsis weberi]|uniref:Putative pectate lyase C n=1 Tax=Escovopsis weberi TaxID=150374 RepID=A0A0M9VVG1_ESCWE|nr:putative pectate lyase C [Escovopsis weberi]
MALVLLAIFALASGAAAQAFPGAVGFGAIATGGNGGTTVHVTNLQDSGTGSFRDAVSQSNRNVVFDVSGYIRLSSPVSLSSHLTINGQSAPGNGVGIMGGESAFNMGKASNVILDHCSVEYGQWDSIDAVGAVNITVSNSIIAVPIGQQFGAHVETGPSTFYRNLWVSAHNRQPLSKDNTQYINNVVYNYQAAYTSGNTGGFFSHDIINNYFITGPSTTSSKNAFYQMAADQSVYAVGNFLDSNNDGVLNGSPDNTVGSSVVLASPWASTSLGLATLSATDAVTYVLANAGASPRDELDIFVVNTVKSFGSQGMLYKSQGNTGVSNGGYGTL